MSNKIVKIPNIGEFEEVEVIEVLVSSGQSILKNDPLITIESDKSSVEIPSTFSGKIKSVNVKVGDKVSEGSIILDMETEEENKKTVEIETEEKNEKPVEIQAEKVTTSQSEKDEVEKNPSEKTLASPKARKFAREVGLNINKIQGSERQGRVIESDIKKFISSKINETPEKKDTKIKIGYEHSDFGEVEIKEMPRVKKLAATYLVNSWSTIPHVTNHDEADITEMEEFRNSLTNIYTGKKKKDYTNCVYNKSFGSFIKKIS